MDEKEKIYQEAINAANRVLFYAGITDVIVSEISFMKAEAAQSFVPGSDIEVVGRYVCSCWDCVSPGCGSGGAGPCCCGGPACIEP